MKRNILLIALGVLGVITIVLAVLLVREYQALNRAGLTNPGRYRMHLSHVHAPLTVNDIGVIQSWMTFDYVNRIFALPADQLKTALKITDARYPHLRLGTYTSDVKDAVKSYLTTPK
ncbi:MAG TPA: hypothetical protein VMU12_00210 [Candidatus Paceibacterota bacterium]|nr:hypothetical protein [Candidatus Paceibacterota bacterium]